MTWQAIQETLAEWCAQRPEVLAAYLFGSRAEGRAGAESDLDLALLARPDLPHQTLWRLEDRWASEVARLFAPGFRTDVFVLNLAPLTVRFQLISRGRVLWARDTCKVAEFESYVRRLSWDFQPYLRVYQRSLENGIKETWDATQRARYRNALEQTRAVHKRVEAAARTES
ncbi:MAG: type VII toxin-antitoxin system MntA family adenylyltransferase antitoxin [Syntrophobacteria bacterium]